MMTTATLPGEFLDILRKNGGRVTPVVSTLLLQLYTSSRIHSPQQIKDELNRILAVKIGFPTIYRILDRLMQTQLVCRMHRDDGQSFFFVCRHPGHSHHHHFICNVCNTVFEIDMCLADHFEKHVAEHLNASITNHIIQLEGICKQCKKGPGRSIRKPQS